MTDYLTNQVINFPVPQFSFCSIGTVEVIKSLELNEEHKGHT